jgi:hypothetical protein
MPHNGFLGYSMMLFLSHWLYTDKRDERIIIKTERDIPGRICKIL